MAQKHNQSVTDKQTGAADYVIVFGKKYFYIPDFNLFKRTFTNNQQEIENEATRVLKELVHANIGDLPKSTPLYKIIKSQGETAKIFVVGLENDGEI